MAVTRTAGAPPAENAPALLDVHAVATLLGCSTRHVRRLADGGRMPAPIRLGSLLRWRCADLDAWRAAAMDSRRLQCHNHGIARVMYEPDLAEQLGTVPQTILRRMETIIRRLQNWPHVSGAKPLRGELAGHWRIRTGDWRVQFRVAGDEVIIERVGHRDRFYE